ncbi:MAG: FAD-dependent oxidoreductase, partial [Pseudarthrobacter sp.]|nr:FAD-dependent oxidoreductase [Pseudarthrobacter sp.]
MTPQPGAAMQPRRLAVVGSGIAGLYAALHAADAGADVVLLTKGGLEQSNTWYAQGGISAVLEAPAPGDSVAAHIADTLRAGAGHCDAAAVRLMCADAAGDIAWLQRYGVSFDTGHGGANDDGGPALGLEAAHSAPRILHAGGDATGARIAAALIQAVLARRDAGRLTLISGAHATALRMSAGTVTGVDYLQAGHAARVDADAVLLATGGAGQLFAQTTNPSV